MVKPQKTKQSKSWLGSIRGMMKRSSTTSSISQVTESGESASPSETKSPVVQSCEPFESLPTQPAQSKVEPLESTNEEEDAVPPTSPEPEPPSEAKEPDGWQAFASKARTFGRITATLIKIIAPCIDTDPIRAVAAGTKAVLEVKQAIQENAERLEEVEVLNADRMLSIGKAIEQSPPGAIERMQNFSQRLQSQRDELDRLTSAGPMQRYFDYEQRKKDIEECFRQIDEAIKFFQLEVLWSVERMLYGVDSSIRSIQLDRFRTAPEATYNAAPESGGRWKRAFCTEGTRVKIQDDIRAWADDRDSPRVFWLTGQAGVGKTTIASSVARTFAKLDSSAMPLPPTVLGGNFLCSRLSKKASQRMNILPTLVYQLAHKSLSFAHALNSEDKFDLVNKPDDQIDDLLVGPWMKAQRNVRRGSGTFPQFLIVIDALDEIEDEEGVVFLKDLLRVVDKLDGLKFLVSSRPHREVEDQLGELETVCRLQNVEKRDVKSDILLYLRSELPNFKGDPDRLEDIATRADGLFIYAATIVRHLNANKLARRIYEEQLDLLQRLLDPSTSTAPDAWSPIDQLYHQVLGELFSNCSDAIRRTRLRILHTCLFTIERLSPMAIASLAASTPAGASQKLVEEMVSELHALLYVTGGRVLWYHQSFPDLISSERARFQYGPTTSAPLDLKFIGSDYHTHVTLSMFRIFGEKLRFNIGDIDSSFNLDDEDVGLPERIKTNIPDDLRYACHYWANHLVNVSGENNSRINLLCREISEFLQLRVLFWIEAMNLLKSIRRCDPLLRKAATWQPINLASNGTLRSCVLEAANFSFHFSGKNSFSTPHLYISALATWKSKQAIVKQWRKAFPGIPTLIRHKAIEDPLLIIPAPDVVCVAFSGDGSRLVCGTRNNSLRLIDVATGTVIAAVYHDEGFRRSISSVYFSPNCNCVVYASTDGYVRVWNESWKGGFKEYGAHYGPVRCAIFSPQADSHRVASGSADHSVRIWSGEDDFKVLEGHTWDVLCVAFSPNGDMLVSGSADGCIRIWDVSTGTGIKVIEGYLGTFIKSLAFSPDGRRFIAGSMAYSVRMWEASTGELVRQFERPWDMLGHNSVAFSPDGSRVVSGSFLNGKVEVWDASTGKNTKSILAHPSDIHSVAFSPDGSRIVSGSEDDAVRIWNASIDDEIEDLKGHGRLVHSVAISPDGRLIASGSMDETLRVWDASTGSQLQFLSKKPRERFHCVTFSPDGSKIATASASVVVMSELPEHCSVSMWDVASGQLIQTLDVGHWDIIHCVAFSADGNRLVSGSEDSTVCIWDVPNGKRMKVINHKVTTIIRSVAFFPDGNGIVSGSFDGLVRICNAVTGEETRVLEGHRGKVYSVAVSPDGSRVISGSGDRSVRLWDAATGQQIQRLRNHSCVYSVAFSPDGSRIFSGLGNHFIRIWDASTGVKLKELKGHDRTVLSVACSSDGKRLVSGSVDRSVRIWDISSWKGDEDPVDDATVPSDDGIERAWKKDWHVEPTEEGKTPPARWILSSSNEDRLMWVPEWNVMSPHTIRIISGRGYSTIDFEQSKLGTEWVKCYVP